MFDIFQFPNITGNTSEEKISQLISYLIQFKEELEFALTNLGTDNLSKDLVEKLNSLGADIEKSNEEREDQIQQVSKKYLTVSDVVNSKMFKDALPSEYLVSVKQIQESNEPNGINIYAITDANGETHEFQVKNGKTPIVTFSVNFETGNLEYTSS